MLRLGGKIVFVMFALTALTLAACGGRRHHARAAYEAPPPVNGVLTCPGNSIVQGNGCTCGAGMMWVDEQCQTATCPGGSTQEGDGCACPNGSAWIQDQCQTCPGGSVANDDGCACPGGTAWLDERCQTVQVAQAEQPAPPPPQEQPARRRKFKGPSAGQIFGAVATVAATAAVAHAEEQRQRDMARSQSSPSQPAAPPPTQRSSSSSSSRVTYAECKGGMVRNGTACQCPQGRQWENNQCVVACHPTARRQGDQCVCPKDTRMTGDGRCELWQECGPGQVRIGATCMNAKRSR